MFTVSRWYHPTSPGETARMLALGMEVLFQRGVEDPRKHLLVLQNFNVATLLLSPTPFSARHRQHAGGCGEDGFFDAGAAPRTAARWTA